MIELKKQVIEYAQKLNSTNLSPLRSGNVSVRVNNNGVEGFLLTPSGKRYESLIPEDIVFLALKEKYDKFLANRHLFTGRLQSKKNSARAKFASNLDKREKEVQEKEKEKQRKFYEAV